VKKLAIILSVVLLFATFGSSPISASDPSTKEQKQPFSVDPNTQGFNIPKGSLIFHHSNGTTQVLGPGNVLIANLIDANTATIHTPSGEAHVSDYYDIPSGSFIDSTGNTTHIYDSNKATKELLLTVIDERIPSPITPPTWAGDWIEQARDLTVSQLSLFDANWYVPESPSNNGTNYDYLFTGIEPSTQDRIAQPVLEWNYNEGGNGWTGAAYYVYNGGHYRATGFSTQEGHELWGYMCNPSGLGLWYVTLEDWDDSGWSGLSFSSSGFNTSNLKVFCALEGYLINGDSDVPGDTLFFNMELMYLGIAVTIDWDPHITSGTGLTGLDVEIYSQATVNLETTDY